MLLKYFTCLTFQSKDKQIQEIQEFGWSSEKTKLQYNMISTYPLQTIFAIPTTKQREQESAPSTIKHFSK